MTDTDTDLKEYRGILSREPPFTTPEGLTFLIGGTAVFVVCGLAIRNSEVTPMWSFVAGVVFVLVMEVAREKLAERAINRRKGD